MAIKVVTLKEGVQSIHLNVRIPGQPEPYKKRYRFYGTRTDAKRYGQELELNAKKGTGSLTTAITSKYNIKCFGDAIDQFVQYRIDNGKIRSSRARVYYMIKRELGGIKQLHAVPAAFKAILDRHKNVWKRNTRTARIKAMRAVFEYLKKIKVVPENPITDTDFAREQLEYRDRVWTADERSRIFAAIKNHYPHIYYIIRMMEEVPCRKSELTSAKRDQYIAEKNMVYIPAERSKTDQAMYKPIITAEMTEYFRNIPADSEYLFYAKRSSGKCVPMTNARLCYAWRHVLAIAGVKDLRMHDLRRVSATRLLMENKLPMPIVEKIGGWKNSTMLKDVYLKLTSMSAAEYAMQNCPENITTTLPHVEHGRGF